MIKFMRFGATCVGMFLLLFTITVSAAERPLSLLLLPPIGGEGSPQLAISWKGDSPGQLELSVIDAAGQRRQLKSRRLEPGMHLDGVELGASDQTLIAVLRDAQGRELARAEQGVRPSAPTLGGGGAGTIRATGSEHSQGISTAA